MKIHNDPLHALQEQGEARRKPEAGAFDALLARELRQGQGEALRVPDSGQSSAVLAMQIRAAQELGGSESLENRAATGEFLGGLDGLLDQWERYAASLQNPSGISVKSLQGALGGLGSDLAALKARLPAADEALRSLVHELEVLTVTEQFKLNRGDYF